MATSRSAPPPSRPLADADLLGGYLPLDQGDCQAMALGILQRCCGGEAERPADRDGHPVRARPGER